MDTCINSYRNCSQECRREGSHNICHYVCQDKFRTCLGDVAKKYGNNNMWPHQNANYDYIPYVAVRDQNRSFPTPPQNNPFAIPPNHITGGYIGMNNRIRPYQYVYADRYGEILKCTKPASRDPIYH